MRTDHLKVKIKSLAAEASIIRHEERKARTAEQRSALTEHRKTVVRSEARHSLLAYGFLRGRAYSSIERTCRQEPDWARVKDMVDRFGGYGAAKRFDNELTVWRQ